MRVVTSACATLILAAAGIGQGPPPPPPPVPPPPVPAGNAITAAKASLGKALFWDEQLSSTRTVACGTCHIPSEGGSDPRSSPTDPAARHPGLDGLFGTPDDVIGSPGVTRADAQGYLLDPAFGLDPQVTNRKASSTVNSAYPRELFWDGRAQGTFRDPVTNAVVLAAGAALESQVLGPPTSAVEMGHVGRDWPAVAAQIAASEPLALATNVPAALSAWIAGRGYPALFQEAFGSPGVTPVRIAMAIATYERTLISNQSRFDQFIAGVPGALTMQEQLGFNLFNSPLTRCGTCHNGPLLSDEQFHYTGVRPQIEDLGRFNVTGNQADRGRMRTPALRNVGLREPLFHNGNGGGATLESVIDFYARGGDFNAPNKAPQIAPFALTPQQRAALIAFLRNALTDPRVASHQPPFDRPTLYTESGRVPVVLGGGRAGSGGLVPRIVALEPPLLGNPSMTFGVDNALGGAPAVLVVSTLQPRSQNPFGRGNSLVSPLGPLRFPVQLAGNGAGAGWASASVALPALPTAAGTELFGQWFVLDPAAPQGVATSSVVSFTLF
jgi:cytochrome c peroxidase